jgi:DNA repair protein RAD50
MLFLSRIGSDINSRTIGNSEGLSHAFESLLKSGISKKTCSACNRGLNDSELKIFDKFVRLDVHTSVWC